jgi:hypothetical protein
VAIFHHKTRHIPFPSMQSRFQLIAPITYSCKHLSPHNTTSLIHYEIFPLHLYLGACMYSLENENGDECTFSRLGHSLYILPITIQCRYLTSVHCLAASSRGYRPALLAHNQITNILPRPRRRAAAEAILTLLLNTNVGHHKVAQHLSLRCSDNTCI